MVLCFMINSIKFNLSKSTKFVLYSKQYNTIHNLVSNFSGVYIEFKIKVTAAKIKKYARTENKYTSATMTLIAYRSKVAQ